MEVAQQVSVPEQVPVTQQPSVPGQVPVTQQPSVPNQSEVPPQFPVTQQSAVPQQSPFSQQAALPPPEIVDPAEMELEKEVDRIQKTAEMQLASVKGLNLSLVKKIRKAEAQAIALLNENKNLEDKNAALVLQLEKAHEEVRTLSIKEENMFYVEEQLEEAKKTVVAKELSVKKTEAERDALLSEKDALESELATVNVRLDTATAALNEEMENNERERERLGKEVNDRDLTLTDLSTERDLAASEKANIEELLKTRDTELLEYQDRIVLLTTQMEKRQQEFDAEIAALTELTVKATNDRETTSRDLDSLRAEHGIVIDEKEKLATGIAALSVTKEELAGKVENYENELEKNKVILGTLEMERDQSRMDAEDKARELAELTILIASLNTERDHLIKTRDGLETELVELKQELSLKIAELNDKDVVFSATERSLGDTKKQLEHKDIELEDRRQAHSILEGERNLLTGTIAQLEKDYEEARLFEKRVYELEEDKKKLRQMIAALEAEKIALVEEHRRELAEQVHKTQEEYALQTAKLRRELDDVVDRHAAIGLEELEPSVEGTTDISEPIAVKTVPMGQVQAALPIEVDDEAEEFKDAKDDHGTLDRAIDLHPPVETPAFPMPAQQEHHDIVESTGGAMVMMREEEEDDDDDLEEDDDDGIEEDDHDDFEDNDDGFEKVKVVTVKDVGPGEGNTAPVVSEVVVEEAVVDDVRDGDDVLEEVDEEVPVPDAEAAGARKALGGMKAPGEDISDPLAVDTKEVKEPGLLSEVADDVTTDAKVVTKDDVATTDDKMKGIGTTEMTPATYTAADTATDVKGTPTGVDGTRAIEEDGSKKSSGILQRLRCCTGGEQGPAAHAT